MAADSREERRKEEKPKGPSGTATEDQKGRQAWPVHDWNCQAASSVAGQYTTTNDAEESKAVREGPEPQCEKDLSLKWLW